MCLSDTHAPYCAVVFFLPLTLKDDLDLSPLKMCSSMRYTCMPNIKFLSWILHKLWPMLKFEQFWPVYLTFDLEGWPWPLPFTTQNVQLHEIHMHAKYQVAIFNIAKVMILTHIFDLWPWKMTLTFHHSKCGAPWDTHACQISSCYLKYCKSYGQC